MLIDFNGFFYLYMSFILQCTHFFLLAFYGHEEYNQYAKIIHMIVEYYFFSPTFSRYQVSSIIMNF